MLEATLVHDKVLLAVSGFGQQFTGHVPQHKWLEHRWVDEESVCAKKVPI